MTPDITIETSEDFKACQKAMLAYEEKERRTYWEKIKSILLETRCGEPELDTSGLIVEHHRIEIFFEGFDPKDLGAWVERLKDRIGMQTWNIERSWESMGYHQEHLARTRLSVELAEVKQVAP